MTKQNKMKKILILGIGKKTGDLQRGLVENLSADIVVDLARFEDVIIDIEQKNTSIFIGDKNILDYDLVYFRRAGKKFIWLAGTISIYLEKNGIKYFDSVYKNMGPIGTKLTSLVKLAVDDLPVVPSVYCYAENIVKNSEMLINKLGLPIVAKDLYSQRGMGVSLLKSKKDIKKLVMNFPGKKFMFQKFINKIDEFRVLVLGSGVGCFERKTANNPKEFRNNVSLGAREDFIEVEKTPKEIRDVSTTAAKSLGIEIAGVDVIIDVNNILWVLEVNRGPGFTYDSKDSPEIHNLARFFTAELKENL